MSAETRDNGSGTSQVEPRRLEVKNWPNVRLASWRRWGFDPSGVVRVVPYNAVFNRREPQLLEREGDRPLLTLHGRWYFLDEAGERRAEKWAWLAGMAGTVLFLSMLAAVKASSGIFAVLAFVCMYLLFEGFPAFVSGHFGASPDQPPLEIPLDAVTDAALLTDRGTLLIQWLRNGVSVALSVSLVPRTAERLADTIQVMKPEEVKVRRYSARSLNQPPG